MMSQRPVLASAETLAGRTCPPTLAAERLLPVLPALAPLLGAPGLRRGTTVGVTGSTALALALVAGPSAAGSWVAAVGLPDLGVVAAAEAGVVLDRFALVAGPPRRLWATVVAALVDGVDVVLVRPPAGTRAADARRLAARVRERGAVLVALGDWPEAPELLLAVTGCAWEGLGQGHGHLTARRVEVLVTGRGAASRERRAHLWLPDPVGAVAAATPAEARPGRPRAVGTGQPGRPRSGAWPPGGAGGAGRLAVVG
jgi:hypothetical protein